MPRLSDDDNELAPRGRADIRQSIRNHDTALSAAAAAVRSSPQKQKVLGIRITPPCATSKIVSKRFKIMRSCVPASVTI